MKQERFDELDQQVESLLDEAIRELRHTEVPPYPLLDMPKTEVRRVPGAPTRSWPVAVSAVVLVFAGWSIYRAEKAQEAVTTGNPARHVASSPIGLTSRSVIRQTTFEANRPNAALAELDRTQFRITQLAMEIREVKIRSRARELLDELHRMVADRR